MTKPNLATILENSEFNSRERKKIAKRVEELGARADTVIKTIDQQYKEKFLSCLEDAAKTIRAKEGAMFELDVYRDFYCAHASGGHDDYLISQKYGQGYRIEGNSKDSSFNKMNHDEFYKQIRDTIISKYLLLAGSKPSVRSIVEVRSKNQRKKMSIGTIYTEFENLCEADFKRRIVKLDAYLKGR